MQVRKSLSNGRQTQGINDAPTKDGCTMHRLFITHTERDTHTHTDREGGENQTRGHREQRCYKNRERRREREREMAWRVSEWLGDHRVGRWMVVCMAMHGCQTLAWPARQVACQARLISCMCACLSCVVCAYLISCVPSRPHVLYL